MKPLTTLKIFILLVFILSITGCQPKVYLMPSPVGIKPGADWFNLSQGTTDDNLLYTLYATNRLPLDLSNKTDRYSIFPSEILRLGFAVHRVGEENTTWQEIYDESLNKDRSKDILLSREYVREVVSHNMEDNLENTSAQADGFFQQIDDLLDQTIDKDILIYVHGANSGFYRATAQGAQFSILPVIIPWSSLFPGPLRKAY